MSVRSALGPSCGATPAGSRAMPQTGQSLSVSRITSGCIGQIQAVAASMVQFITSPPSMVMMCPVR